MNEMRSAYKELSEEEKQQIARMKETGQVFWDLCDGFAPSRELSLAKTKIEEAVMWAVKHVTK